MICKECGGNIGFFDFLIDGLCNSCSEKREIKRKERNKAIDALKKYIEYSDNLDEKSTQHYVNWVSYRDIIYIYPYSNTKKEPLSFDREKLMDLIIKNKYNINKVINEIVENELIKLETSKIAERRRKRQIREKAEEKIYGKVKTKRTILTEEEKEMIFDKFNNECSICGRKEGLHIHHKDENSSNNAINNLIVLCGVCHKKIHMKVR